MLEALTGTPYFPGGLGEFVAKKNEFLVFEQGPSEDVVLQWATYRDASDETSLSRIWGGIHPPVDDIPGRRVGILVGADAMSKSTTLFEGEFGTGPQVDSTARAFTLFPNPVTAGTMVSLSQDNPDPALEVRLIDATGRIVRSLRLNGVGTNIPTDGLPAGLYFLQVSNGSVGKLLIR